MADSSRSSYSPFRSSNTIAEHVGNGSSRRRGSLSLSQTLLDFSSPPADLEQIHASSCQTPGLTSFSLASPPSASTEQLLLGGLYSRVKSVAAAVRDAVGVHTSSGGSDRGGDVGSESYLGSAGSRDSFLSGASDEPPGKGASTPPLSPTKFQLPLAGKRSRYASGSSLKSGSRISSNNSSIDMVSGGLFAPPAALRKVNLLANGVTVPSLAPVTVFRDISGYASGGELTGNTDVNRQDISNSPKKPAGKGKGKDPQSSTVNVLLGATGVVVAGTVGCPAVSTQSAAGGDDDDNDDDDGTVDNRARDDGSLFVGDEDEEFGSVMTDEEAITDSSDDDNLVLLNSRLPGGHDVAQLGGSRKAASKSPASLSKPNSRDTNSPSKAKSNSSALLSPPAKDVNGLGLSLASDQVFSNSHAPHPSPPGTGSSNPTTIKSTLGLPQPLENNHPSALQKQMQNSNPSGQLLLPSPNLKPLSDPALRRKRPPPPVSRISTDQSQLLPGFKITREPSSDTESSHAATSNDGNHKQSGDSSVYRQGFDDAGINSDTSITGAGNSEAVSQALRQLRMGNLTRDFWMKDEVCKECFLCGNTFSAWRRKHHCRLCGQIFCSKCTTLITGERFGHQGSMRVCNPCLAIVNDYQDESDSDEFSSSTVFHHNQVMNQRNGTPTGNSPSNSAAATPIGEPMTPFSMPKDMRLGTTPLMAIPATRMMAGKNPNRHSQILEINAELPSPPRPSSVRSGKASLPRAGTAANTPALIDGLEAQVLPAFHSDNIIDPDLAPYMSDEDISDSEQMSIFATIAPKYPEGFGSGTAVHAFAATTQNDNTSSTGPNAPNPSKSKSRNPGSIGGMASILAGGGIGAGDPGSPKNNLLHPARSTRKRNSSFLSSMQPRPPTRSGKGHRLMRSLVGTVGESSLFSGAGGSVIPSPRAIRTTSIRGPLMPLIELNTASLNHVRTLLRQLLKDAEIKEVDKWERALMPILLKSTDDLNPDVRVGDSIDIRHYVKVKRIPGGAPGDTTYVSGVVFTKNLALKSMPRSVPQPRIVIITFPIEYQRHQQQLMSLEPVIAQEKDFLQNMVNRIIALRPTLLLVEKNISGVALQLLSQANIATAHLVKPSVIEAVARCAQADIFSSVDKLALPSYRIGRCASLDVKTFVHDDIPGRKKTFMYFSGCPKELGCTIVLRGGDMVTLATIKRITELMVYVVYNLKLETCLMRDEFANIPSTPATGGISSRLPDDLLPDDIPMPTYYEDMVRNHETKVLSASPFVKYIQPYLLMRARELERRLVYLRRLKDSQPTTEKIEGEKTKPPEVFQLVQPEMVHGDIKNGMTKKMAEVLRAIHDAEYDKALYVYQTQKKQWENYLAQYDDLFDPYAHQNIAILYSLVCTITMVPCEGPEIRRLEFYVQDPDWPLEQTDCTLGQYVEYLCDTAFKTCNSDTCDKKMIDHHRSYVHGQARVNVFVRDKMPSPIQGMHDSISMWSYCKICPDMSSPPIPMSESTWKYSFGKYLELAFWSSEMKLKSGSCIHDLNRDHVRCFGYRGLTVLFQYESIELLEIVVPRTKIAYKPEIDLRIKNECYTQYEDKMNRFFSSVKSRLRDIKVNSVSSDKIDACKAEIEALKATADTEHNWLIKKLQEKYNKSKYFEIIPLNRALRALQERVVEWDARFSAFDNDYFPSEKDIRRLAALQLKRLFIDNPNTAMQSDTERAPTLGKEEKPAAVDGTTTPGEAEPTPGEMSSKQAHDVLASVVEEDAESSPKSDASKENRATLEKMPPPFGRTHSVPTVPQRKPETSGPSGTILRPLTYTTSMPIKKTSDSIRGKDKIRTDKKVAEKTRVGSLTAKKTQEKSQIPRSIPPPKRRDSNVSTLAKHFEQMSREFEKERAREKRQQQAKRSRALPVATSKPVVEVYRSVREAVEELSDEELPVGAPTPGRDLSNLTESTESTSDADVSDGEASLTSDPETVPPPPSIAGALPPPLDTPLQEKRAWMKTLSNFWAERSASGWSSLEYPLHPTDHVFNDSDIIVREDEPSSLIAFALNSQDYEIKLDSIRNSDTSGTERPQSSEEAPPSHFPDGREHPELERSLLKATGTHLKYQFQEGSAKMFCKIFYAEQFDALRQNCGVADRYVESLSRCVKWDSKGGKTKSVFLKTQDERIVLKALSPIETAAFIKFAPAYFQFMSQAFFHELPTVIAKMLGFYQIYIKNTTTGTDIKWDVLVMENLFYDRKTTRIFDLKGSMRNRYTHATGDQNEVLLDENMVEFIYESPLFVREHSKKLLRASLWNDTLFLSRQNVMDYSLMIGIDEAKKELVVGIIGKLYSNLHLGQKT
ncbi:hypothetical protein HOY82DRAFT_490098 [Tuber indicum]|nr:hypothetical protein HOY82DRAFT_490098 [Tuber indicum]